MNVLTSLTLKRDNVYWAMDEYECRRSAAVRRALREAREKSLAPLMFMRKKRRAGEDVETVTLFLDDETFQYLKDLARLHDTTISAMADELVEMLMRVREDERATEVESIPEGCNV